MDFAVELQSSPEKLFSVLKNFNELPQFLPRQLAKVRILQQEKEKVVLEVILVFKTLVKKEIIQKVSIDLHDNSLNAVILDGPAEKTQIELSLVKKDLGTNVIISIDLKLSLKAKILSPIIKREYKNMLRGIFIKMDVTAKELGN